MRLVEGDEVELTAVDRGTIGIADVAAAEDVLAQFHALQRPASLDLC